MDYFGVRSPSVNGQDSMSLQEMLDMDIKSDADLESVFGCGDINLNFTELPALNLDEDSLGAPGDNNVWFTNSRDSSLLGGENTNSSISHELNSLETRMVSPNSVMPVTLIEVPYESLKVKNEEKVEPKIKMETFEIKDEAWEGFSKKMMKQEINFTEEEEDEADDSNDDDVFAQKMSVLSSVKNFHQTKSLPQANSGSQRLRITTTANHRSPSHGNRTFHHSPGINVKKAGASTLSVRTTAPAAKKRLANEYSDGNNGVVQYPKPAYSYSCLIAMALKNSPNGSLPVSEIYNFMCKHFPYFKTAPNGWKNSVRHNLSLNKCFEKIEKPATNGSQRKGCLWAMNPNKVDKMNEEVSKWSKKDKSAIKKSMIYPESLDALEQGLFVSSPSKDENSEDGENEYFEEEVDYPNEPNDGEKCDPLSDRLKEERHSIDQDDYDSDDSLNDLDVEVRSPAAVLNGFQNTPTRGQIKMRVNVQTSPSNGSFQPLTSGGVTYAVTSQANENSPKRLKTLGGSRITGNYVYKPLGASAIRKRSPLRPTLLSSLEADD